MAYFSWSWAMLECGASLFKSTAYRLGTSVFTDSAIPLTKWSFQHYPLLNDLFSITPYQMICSALPLTKWSFQFLTLSNAGLWAGCKLRVDSCIQLSKSTLTKTDMLRVYNLKKWECQAHRECLRNCPHHWHRCVTYKGRCKGQH